MNNEQAKIDCEETTKQCCIDIYTDFDSDEIAKESRSVQNAWEAGRRIVQNI